MLLVPNKEVGLEGNAQRPKYMFTFRQQNSG